MPVKGAVALSLITLLVWLGLVWGPQEGWRFSGLQIAQAPRGCNFHLQSSHGPVQLDDFRGKRVLLYFGYTWCPDICPTTLTILAKTLQLLAPHELEQVQAVFVSLDPERDGLESLASYAHYFHPRILALTGSVQSIQEAAGCFGVSYRKAPGRTPGAPYSIDHSANTYLIGADGEWIDTIPHGVPAQQVKARLVRGLSQPSASSG